MNYLYVIIDTETGKLWEGYNGRLSWRGRGHAAAAWTVSNQYLSRIRFREQSRYVIKEVNFVVAPKTRLEVSEVILKNG